MAVFELRSLDGNIFKLDGDVVRLGRASDNTIIVNDPAVSRYHINFYLKDEGLIAEDAGSANGFAVNGQICKTSIALGIGDKIVIGTREYRVEDPENPAPLRMAGGAAATFGSRPGPANVNSRPTTEMPRATIVSTPSKATGSRAPFLIGGAVVALAVMIYAREGERAVSRNPASETRGTVTTPLATDGFRPKRFTPLSTSEIKAEARFRESMRDYYNGNFSRAMLGFREALTLMPSHAEANDYLVKAESSMQSEIKDLLNDGQRSVSILQYFRAKNQAVRILSILSEQTPQYSRKVASEVNANGIEKQNLSQEQILLEMPCDSAKKSIDICKQAVELLKQTRKLLGEEDTLR